MTALRWLARGLRAVLGELGLLGLAVLRWALTIAACLVGVALAAFVNAALVDAAAPPAGGIARLLDAREALVSEAFYAGGVTAFVAMLALGFLVRLGLRGAWPTLACTLGTCATIGVLVLLDGGMHFASPQWPLLLAPLPAALTGLGAWRLLEFVLHNFGLSADIAADLSDGGIDP